MARGQIKEKRMRKKDENSVCNLCGVKLEKGDDCCPSCGDARG